MTFGDNITGNIVVVGKVGKSSSHSIDNVFLIECLKHNLPSISQFCDKGTNLKFTNKCCVVSDVGIGTKILEGTTIGEKSRRAAQVGLRFFKRRSPIVEGLRLFKKAQPYLEKGCAI